LYWRPSTTNARVKRLYNLDDWSNGTPVKADKGLGSSQQIKAQFYQSIACTQLTHGPAYPPAEESAQCYPIFITNLSGNHVNAIAACLQQVYAKDKDHESEQTSLSYRRLSELKHRFKGGLDSNQSPGDVIVR
jgi:hypothetical protein